MTQQFDVAVLDHHLLGRDGLWLIGKLPRLPGGPAIVMLTGSGDGRIAPTGKQALGLGLGLYIMKRIIFRAHGGSVEVVSHQNDRTTFSIYIPPPPSASS